jgi:hypothetical protein
VTIRVRKVAEIVDNFVATSGRDALYASAVLTGLQPAPDPIPGSAWKLGLVVGEGTGARRVVIDLPPILSKDHPVDIPVLIGEDELGRSLFYYKDRLFLSDRSPVVEAERAEIALRIKKAIYDEQAELTSLRAAVANLEAALEYQRSGPRRDPIPDDVKLVVWARDGGACIRCGANQELHFDHVIPLAKGGGNTEANIQILCQTCNLRKSDKIGA